QFVSHGTDSIGFTLARRLCACSRATGILLARPIRSLRRERSVLLCSQPMQPLEPPEPLPEQVSWNVYECAGKVGRWIGIVEARSGEAAIVVAAEQFGYRPSNLIAIRRKH